MYYEERVIDGELMYRVSPRGEWKQVLGAKGAAFQSLALLSDEERKAMFGHFCVHCGSDNPKCQCWNDE